MKAFRRWLIRARSGCLFGHDWRTSLYPEEMYPGISEWAGTKRCRRCDAFRFYTASETDEFWATR